MTANVTKMKPTFWALTFLRLLRPRSILLPLCQRPLRSMSHGLTPFWSFQRSSRTLTYTSQFPHRTGLEIVGGVDDSDLAYWNDTGAVWMVSIESGYAIQDLGIEPSDIVSTAITQPNSTAFTLTVPTQGCESMYASYSTWLNRWRL